MEAKKATKVLFADCDGVMNNERTPNRFNFFIGLDPFMVLLVHRICDATGAKIVVSSDWRLSEDTLEEVKRAVSPHFLDVTPNLNSHEKRGLEVNAWLADHPEVERFAILDDNNWFLPDQQPHFFKTSWAVGLTEEIAERVMEHLGAVDKPVEDNPNS